MMEFVFSAFTHSTHNFNKGNVEFPFGVVQAFGCKSKQRLKRILTGIAYRGSFVKKGHSYHIWGINKQVRKTIKKNPGDHIEIIIKEDVEERIVEIPTYLVEVFISNPEAKKVFINHSFIHQKNLSELLELNDVAKC